MHLFYIAVMHTGVVKIGVTRKPIDRRMQQHSKRRYEINPIFIVRTWRENAYHIEREVARKMAPYRIYAKEWLKPTAIFEMPTIKAFIKELYPKTKDLGMVEEEKNSL
jgi:hypothetical protein